MDIEVKNQVHRYDCGIPSRTLRFIIVEVKPIPAEVEEKRRTRPASFA
jgi:hypothetical protein